MATWATTMKSIGTTATDETSFRIELGPRRQSPDPLPSKNGDLASGLRAKIGDFSMEENGRFQVS